MIRAMHAEWTKLRTLPSTTWSVLAMITLTVVLGTFATMGLGSADVDTVRFGLIGVYLGQLAVVCLAALAVTPEYDTSMIRTTLAADPRRTSVYTAKAAVVTAIVLAAAAISVLGTLISGLLILPGNGHPPPSLADGPTLRAYAGTVLYLGLVALLTLGAGFIIRHTGATITVVLSLLYLFPIVAQVINDEQVRKWIGKLAPMPAGLTVQATERLDSLPIAPWAGLGVLGGYTTAALLTGALLFTIRDT